MAKEYDVIVIGAGPAGGSCALHCARNGLSVMILEEHEKIGEPVHCGECLSLYAVKNTGINPPQSVISEHVKGVRVVFPDGTASVLNEPGFVLEKEKFEQWLCAEAVNAGAEIRLGHRLEALERKGAKWEAKTSKAKFVAKIIIDASGVASVVSRLVGLNPRFEAVTGIQYELQGIPRDGYLDFYIWPRLAPQGYLWMIPKKDTRANVGLVTTERRMAKTNTDKFVEEMGWSSNVKVKTFGGLIPASGPLKNTHSDGIMLIGDAAGFTSPLFEGGSHLGLKSGEMAANVAKDAIGKGDWSQDALAKYEAMWKGTFPQYEKIIRGKKALYSFTDDELNLIAKNFPRNFDDFGTLEKIVFGIKVLSKKPGLINKGFIGAMKAFEYSQAQHYGW
ncbi:MAG: NAD(P)/FAD-dependent oxidoreductase [archaeon]|nr:NAD(P)/FAD-dependent oxidoreductase [archaeon]